MKNLAINHTQSNLHFQYRSFAHAINRTFIILIFICFFSSVHAQSILAGQTTDNNVYYFDIEDIYIYTGPNEMAYATVDLDQDNINDIKFEVSWYIGPGSESARSSAEPLNDTWISIIYDDFISGITDIDAWIKKHLLDDIIDLELNWSQEAGILFGYFTDYWGNTTYSGEFNELGFLAFRIINVDTIIGWMRIDPSTSDLTISDYAFYAVFTGNESQEKETTNFLYNNPCYDQLTVHNPLLHSVPYILTGMTGVVISRGTLFSGNNLINVESCYPGLFFLTINERTFKVLKFDK